ncbi:uncharacterized protein LOC131659346 [Vicia villosa]|uniref:uncharacterized protein LOC131659346 n=1 Tax=Vicia villosa TaxID=3911 RepID=UPI00273B991C|nr:uncharacterized protein LOC131659346 [Vicia villosa]
MTIEDLIESTEKCFGSVLVRTCELDTDAGWFYQACSKCASKINIIEGKLYCDRCKMPKTAVPRFKVHIQVIDKTGSTTFILFDRIVSQVLGRNVQDLLDSMGQGSNANAYPSDLDTFLDKQILFKVEITNNEEKVEHVEEVTRLADEKPVIKCVIFYSKTENQHGKNEEEIQRLNQLKRKQQLSVIDSFIENHNEYNNMLIKCLISRYKTEKQHGENDAEIQRFSRLKRKQQLDLKHIKKITLQNMEIDSSIENHNEYNNMVSITNGEESDIPSNSDIMSMVENDNELNTMVCMTNVEESNVPSNSGIQFPLEIDNEQLDDTANSDSQYLNMGHPICVCEFCGALMWYEERVQKQYRPLTPKFSMCCMQGKILIAPYPTLPQSLHDLYHKHDRRSKFFLENIRSFNSMFAFTSMGGKINKEINNGNAPPIFVMNGENFHQIGSLLPLPGNQPKFSQLYIYDTDNEIANRMAVVRMDGEDFELKSTIVSDIREVLDNFNPYVKTYRIIRDTITKQNAPTMKLIILRNRGCDGRRYNLPTASEVAALVVGDFDSVDFDRDVVVETQSGLLQRISVFEPTYLPLQYPLLLPRGEDGFRKDIPYNEDTNTSTSKRKFVTQKEWVAYKIQQRDTNQSTLLFFERLFQQFLVDSFSAIESSRLKWIRDHQKDLRAEIYKGLTEAILRGETNPTSSGKRIVFPSTFVGGVRYMIQNYQDAMAICGWIGYPDLFITFTCNHKWPELVDFLKTYHLKPEDRPDLVSRLFKIKLDQLIKDIKKGTIFGKVKSVIYTIEFQKHGLPHAHILVFLQTNYKCVCPNDIDKIISAEIPNKDKEPELFKVVSSLMIHGPCGAQNKKTPCMHNGKCSKHFPKKFVDSTVIDEDIYPVYKRRDNDVFIQKGDSFVDNRFVVPYNKHLLLKYNAHINVEWCNQSRSIKYLFKYVNKGHDRVTVAFYSTGNEQNKSDCLDEIKMYYDCRYLSACEAVWRIFSFDINYREPSVERLNFHLKNEQHAIYDDYADIQDVVNKKYVHCTKFLAWMDANKIYPKAKNLTYSQFPTKFVWKVEEHEWAPRKQGFAIGRLHFVPPGSGEIFYLRTLLNHVKGPTSFEEIKTVNNDTKKTFKEACYALGFLDDDKEYIDAIVEASQWGTGEYLRLLFATLLLSKQISHPDFVWNNTWEYLCDDILHKQRRLLHIEDMVLTPDQLKSYALAEIETFLQSNNKSLEDYLEMPQAYVSLIPKRNNTLIYDELNYDRKSLVEEHRILMSTMTVEQKGIYDRIMKRVNENKPGFFFLYGYGGTGKTYIWRSMSAALRSKGEIVITVASSGIAALLIPGGRTEHSRFCIPINVDECSTCEITPKSDLADLIAKAKMIIWDEAPMMHKHCFEAVDRTLRDILRSYNNGSLDIPFGGKVVVLGGDFRQILPIIPKGTRQDVVHATINSSYLWNFCEVLTLTTNMRLLTRSSTSDIEERTKFSRWILGIGDGSIGETNDENITINIPNNFLIPSFGDPLAAIVQNTYPNLFQNMSDQTFFQDRAILAPKNIIVDSINDYMLDLVSGKEIIYLSFDSPYYKNSDVDIPNDIHTPEFLNTIISSGLPNHKLRLKVGVPVMLLRNIEQSLGLCNGTRLIITKMGKYVVEAKVISGSNIGQKVYIPRLSLTPSDKRIPFKFQRRQFPLAVSFAMTINKSQGQSLKHVGVYLPQPIFSHGQLYVTISRVTSKKGLKILVTNDEGEDIDTTSNVVYKEIFNNIL